MNETYLVNFTSYQNHPYFLWGTATSDRITFYTTNSNNNNYIKLNYNE